MKIIIYLLLIIIILLLIYNSFYNVKEPIKFKKWKKKRLKQLKKVTKPVNKKFLQPINKVVVSPVVSEIKKIIFNPMIKAIKPAFVPTNNKQESQPEPEPEPEEVIPSSPYIYKEHSNIPDSYNDEILDKLEIHYNIENPVSDNIVTNDKVYKCSFNNTPRFLNNKFVRTIIDPSYNFSYNIDSTNCSSLISPENCNTNENYNMEFHFVNETPNQYLDYGLDKNKVFLNYKEEDGTIKTFKDYYNVPYEDVNPFYSEDYSVCDPSSGSFNKEYGFEGNFPCGTIVCDKISEEEQGMLESEYNYEELNNKAKDYYDQIIKYEHESAIDKLLESVTFKTWISFLNQNQENNTKILNEIIDVE